MSNNDTISHLFEQFRSVAHRPEAITFGKQILAESKKLATPDVLLKYLHDENRKIRHYAAEALANFEEPEVARHLIGRFELETEANDEEVQVDIVLSLRHQKTLLALQALIEIAKDQKQTSWVRSEAAFGVAISTIRNVYEPLFEMLMRPDEHSEYDVIEAVFGAFEWLEESDNGIPAKMTALLRAGKLSERNIIQAIHFLGLRRYKPAYETILQFLDDDGFRQPAAVALGNMGDRRALPKLQSVVNDPRDWVALAISKAIEKLQIESSEHD